MLTRAEGRKGVNAAKDEVKKSDLTYTDSNYQQMADTLYIAMKGAGTDYSAIKRTLSKLKTKSDWNQLVVKFGVRKTNHFYYTFEGNLIEWLIDELSGSEQESANSILSKIGVTI